MDNKPSKRNAGVDPLPVRSRGDQEENPRHSLVYDALIRQYGEVMQKIGRLEAQMADVTNQLSRNDSPLAEELGRPEDLGAGIGSAENTSRSSEEPSERRSDEELRQLRLQVTSLANQLQQTEEQLTQVAGVRIPRPHRRVKHRSWWKRAARRLGLHAGKQGPR